MFNSIVRDLNLNTSLIDEFTKTAWEKMRLSLIECPNRTLTFNEAFLGWLLILKLKPRTMLELGGQHGQSGLVWVDALKRIGGKFITVELGDDPRNKYERPGTLSFLPNYDKEVVKKWGDANELLPEILATEDVDFVFHDCDHTWDSVLGSVSQIFNKDPKIVQTCHDCADGLWQPNVDTIYGKICAERPIFDQYFNNDSYYYKVFSEKNGFGVAIHKEIL